MAQSCRLNLDGSPEAAALFCTHHFVHTKTLPCDVVFRHLPPMLTRKAKLNADKQLNADKHKLIAEASGVA
jgi:hypothetical protein